MPARAAFQRPRSPQNRFELPQTTRKKAAGMSWRLETDAVANPFNAAFLLLLALDYSRVSAAETRPHGAELWLLKTGVTY
jgi:hypothetical protein